MIPDQLRWSLIRRRQLSKSLLGFNAHPLSYATPDCTFNEHVRLHRNSKLYSCHLERGTYVETGSSLSKVSTGKFCSIGPGVRIGLGRHPTDFLSTHPAFYSSNSQTRLQITQVPKFQEAYQVVTGNDVWIGANCLIMGGISIGDGAIIGAGSIVTKNVPPYAIAVGSPAKVIRYRFDDQTISMLLSLQWWNKSDQEIERIVGLISPNGPIDLLEFGRYMETHTS